MISEYLQMMFSLGIVLSLMFICILFLKKSKFKPGRKNQQQLQILQTLSLGSKEKIILIEVNRVRLLIGVTSHQIQTLHSFGEKKYKPFSLPDSNHDMVKETEEEIIAT